MAEPVKQWVEAGPEWRVIGTRIAKFCRYPRCTCPAVAELNRKRFSNIRYVTTDCWWAYCGEHLYGRLIADGKVMEERYVEKETTHG